MPTPSETIREAVQAVEGMEPNWQVAEEFGPLPFVATNARHLLPAFAKALERAERTLRWTAGGPPGDADTLIAQQCLADIASLLSAAQEGK